MRYGSQRRRGVLLGAGALLLVVLLAGGAQVLRDRDAAVPPGPRVQDDATAGRALSTLGLRTIWSADYEPPDDAVWSDPQSRQGRVTRVSQIDGTTVRRGRFAARFEVRSGDSDVAGSGDGERAEIFIGEDATAAREGVEQWWAWSTLFDSGFSANISSWNTFTQWHNSGTSGGTTGFQVRGNEIWFESYGGDPSNATRKSFRIVDERVNAKWYDFVFHVRWSSTPNVGFVEIWVNGHNVLPKVAAPTLYEDQTVYLKQGYYRNPQPTDAVIYHDGTRRLAAQG